MAGVVSLRVGVFGCVGVGKSTLVASLVAVHGRGRNGDAGSEDTAALLAATNSSMSAADRYRPAEWSVMLPLDSSNKAKMIVVDVPGVLCDTESFFEAPEAVRERLGEREPLQLDSLSSPQSSPSSSAGGKKEPHLIEDSAASVAMICDAAIVCYDPCMPETLDAAKDLLNLLAGQKDPLPLRAVLCATRTDKKDAPEVARQSTIDTAVQIAEDHDYNHTITAALKDRSGVDGCFCAAVVQAQRSHRLTEGVVTEDSPHKSCCTIL